MRASLRTAADRLEIALYGDNLLDDHYRASINQAALGGNYYGRYGDPRTYGAQIRIATQ